LPGLQGRELRRLAFREPRDAFNGLPAGRQLPGSVNLNFVKLINDSIDWGGTCTCTDVLIGYL